MRPTFLLCFALLCFTCTLFPAVAQQSSTIRGTILQPDHKTLIPGAAITNLKTNITILAGETGKFDVSAAPQDSFLVRAIGYKPLLYIAGANAAPILILEQSSVKLTEVEVRSKPEPVKAVSTQIKRPGYNPALEPPPPPPAPLPSVILNPVSAFSKEGQQKRKLSKLKKAQSKEQKKEQAQQQKEDYNRFFKDNTGYQ